MSRLKKVNELQSEKTILKEILAIIDKRLVAKLIKDRLNNVL